MKKVVVKCKASLAVGYLFTFENSLGSVILKNHPKQVVETTNRFQNCSGEQMRYASASNK